MTSTNNNSRRGLKYFFLGIGFCVLFSFNSFAQGEKEKGMQDFPRNTDDLGQFESPESTQTDWRLENNRLNSVKSAENKAQTPQNTVRRENPIYRQGGEKDTRREGMSTLSFNLFLYIVDKFRED